MKTIKEKVVEQLQLQDEMRRLTNINIVNCGSCGSVLLHRISDDADDIDCPYCDFTSEPCDFPDFLYSGMELQEVFNELIIIKNG